MFCVLEAREPSGNKMYFKTATHEHFRFLNVKPESQRSRSIPSVTLRLMGWVTFNWKVSMIFVGSHSNIHMGLLVVLPHLLTEKKSTPAKRCLRSVYIQFMASYILHATSTSFHHNHHIHHQSGYLFVYHIAAFQTKQHNIWDVTEGLMEVVIWELEQCNTEKGWGAHK